MASWQPAVNSTSATHTASTIELGNASDTTLSRGSAGVLAVEGVNVLLNAGALGTPSSGTLTNCTGLPVAGITSSTSTALGVGSIELGNASDTTLSQSGAGILAVEGLDIPSHYTIRAASTITQANDGNPHAIFTTPTNGRITLGTGPYKFRGLLAWTSMSATSGNIKVDILGAGTATTGSWLWMSNGADIATGTLTNLNGAIYTTSASGASIVNAQTNTACQVIIEGTFEITVAGTLIPT